MPEISRKKELEENITEGEEEEIVEKTNFESYDNLFY